MNGRERMSRGFRQSGPAVLLVAVAVGLAVPVLAEPNCPDPPPLPCGPSDPIYVDFFPPNPTCAGYRFTVTGYADDNTDAVCDSTAAKSCVPHENCPTELPCCVPIYQGDSWFYPMTYTWTMPTQNCSVWTDGPQVRKIRPLARGYYAVSLQADESVVCTWDDEPNSVTHVFRATCDCGCGPGIGGPATACPGSEIQFTGSGYYAEPGDSAVWTLNQSVLKIIKQVNTYNPDPGDPNHGTYSSTITVRVNEKAKGKVAVKFRLAPVQCVAVHYLRVGCDGCSSGDCKAGGASAGLSNGPQVGFSLGDGAKGKAAGFIDLFETAETALEPGETLSLARRSALSVTGAFFASSSQEGLQRSYDPNGVLTAVQAWPSGLTAQLTDISVGNPGVPDSYSIEFLENGYYPIGVAWLVEDVGDPNYTAGVRLTKCSSVNWLGQPVDPVLSYTYLLTGSGGDRTWQFITRDPNNTVVRTETETWVAATGTRTNTIEQDGFSETTRETRTSFSWGEEVTSSTVDPNGLNLTTLNTYYDDGQGGPEQENRLAKTVNPDGSWEAYRYATAQNAQDPNTLDRIVTEYRGWLSTTAPTDPNNLQVIDTTAQVTVTRYDGGHGRPISVTEYAAGVVVGRTEYDYVVSADALHVTQVTERRCTSTDGTTCVNPLVTVTGYEADGDGDRITYRLGPDGRQTDYRYLGTWTTVIEPNQPLPGDTQRAIQRDDFRRPTLETTTAYVGETNVGLGNDIGWVWREYDSLGRVTDAHYSDGTTEHTDYESCCGGRTVTDRMGVKTHYAYDKLGRLTQTIRYALPSFTWDSVTFDAIPELTATCTYSYTGDLRQERVATTITGQTVQQVSIRRYDRAGRVVEEQEGEDPNTSVKTIYAYANTDDGHKVTIYRDYPLSATAGTPGLRDEVTEYYRDGRVKSVTGGAVVGKHYSYGPFTTTIATGAANSPRVQTTTVDQLGRTASETQPAYGGGSLTTSYVYYPATGVGAGQLKSRTTTGLPSTLYEYDAAGRTSCVATDLNGNGQIDEGTDRITKTVTFFDSAFWQQPQCTRQYTYPLDGNDTPRLVQASWKYPGEDDDDTLSRTTTKTYKSNGTDVWQSSSSKVEYFHGDANDPNSPLYTVETGTEAGFTASAVRVSYGGLTLLERTASGATTRYTYDGLGRQTRVDGPRQGTWSKTNYDAAHRVSSTETSGGLDPNTATSLTTTYGYYGPSDPLPGRLKSVTDPLNQTMHYDYTAHGQPWRVWGAVPQPAEIGYDPNYDERVSLTTYRTPADPNSTTWTGSTWPAAVTGDVTQWVYDPATGLLTDKIDAASATVHYTYTADGRQLTRTWARGVVTTYGYDPNTAALQTVDHSDTSYSPDLSLAYNRQGQILTVTAADPNVTDHAFNYASAPEQVIETVSGLFSRTVTRTFADTANGRLTGLQVDGTNDPYNATYTYDPNDGRMWQVRGPGVVDLGGTAYAEYGYVPGSDLVWTMTIGTAGNVRAQTTRTYEPHRNALTSIHNVLVQPNDANSPYTMSHYDYTNDTLGRRTDMGQSGLAFLAAKSRTYGYNARSELTGATNSTGSGDPNWTYTYDPIGNRAQFTETGQAPRAYSVNELNEYFNIRPTTTSAGTAHLVYDADGNLSEQFVAGDMNCDGSVNWRDIDGLVAAQNDNCSAYYALFPNCNCMNGDFNGDGHVNWRDVDYYYGSANTSGPWVAYTWDAENRLAAVTPRVPQVDVSQKVEMGYDYLGRRVDKRVYTWQGSPGSWVLTARREYVWSGWLLLMELDGLDTGGTGGQAQKALRRYTWGLDLAGQNGSVNSLEGAGGIGGLLGLLDANGTWNTPYDDKRYTYFYDANGNVGQLVSPFAQTFNLSTALAARYEYDPYGRSLLDVNDPNTLDPNHPKASGPYAAANPFRFSTKQFDNETGLGYWGYRYYHPGMGRWMSRDPIEEEGGINLSCYCRNDPAACNDSLGEMGKGQMAGKCNQGIQVTGKAGLGKKALIESAEKIRELASAAKSIKERQRLIKQARAIEAAAKVVGQAKTYKNKFGRKAAASIEGLCCMAATEVLFLEAELFIELMLNDAYAAEAMAYDSALDQWQQRGWNQGIALRSQVNFTCCGRPYDNLNCRTDFYRRMSVVYGNVYVLMQADKFAEAIERVPDRVEKAVEDYVECLTGECRRGTPGI